MGRRPADIFAPPIARLWFDFRAIALAAALTALPANAFGSEEFVGPPHATNESVASPESPPQTDASQRDDSSILEQRPLGPASVRRNGSEFAEPPSSGPSSMRTIGALGVVIVLIFLTRWAMRKAANRVGGMSSQLGPGGRAPSGVLTVLARYPVGRGQSLVLLQMDQRVLLLNQTTQGFQTLAEITDPEEVASLLVKTRDEESESLASRFTGMLKRFERDPEIVDRNEWPSRNPTTVDAAMRLFPEAAPSRSDDSADPLAAIRRRVADLEGTLA